MSAEAENGADRPTLAEAYRQHPEGFRSLAEKAEGKLAERMKAAIEAVDGEDGGKA